MTIAAHSLVLMILPLSLLYAAASDLHRYIIPNTASLALIAGAAVCLPLAVFISPEFGWAQVSEHLLTGLACFALGFAFFALGLWGGGDGKLLAAAALWFDWPTVIDFVLATTLAGGALGLLVMLVSFLSDNIHWIPGLHRCFKQIDWARRK
ncbi:MAG: prepilin peptidase, partial [Pseudomonadota bacterium]